MATYKIAPTDLTFLYEECPRCFYNKVHKIWTRPWTGFPSIFGKIDKCVREALHNKSCESLLGIPGTYDTKECKITSKPIGIGGHEIIFSGKMDIRVVFADGTIGIIDAKTSDPSDSSMSIYDRQLHCYRDILTNPDKGEPAIASLMGLLITTPERLDFDPYAELSSFQFRTQFKEIKIDRDKWLETLLQVVNLLSGPQPKAPEKCQWCAMQQAGEILAQHEKHKPEEF